MDIREANSFDLTELVRLNDEVQRQHATLYPFYYIYPVQKNKVSRFFESVMNNDSATLLVAPRAKGLSGYLYFETQDYNASPFKFPMVRYYIHQVVVEKKSRRTGIAKKMFKYVERAADTGENTQIALHTMDLNTEAHLFFESMGFTAVMRKYSKLLP